MGNQGARGEREERVRMSAYLRHTGAGYCDEGDLLPLLCGEETCSYEMMSHT